MIVITGRLHGVGIFDTCFILVADGIDKPRRKKAAEYEHVEKLANNPEFGTG
ncbi:hypothetical protein GCM10022212_28880 [Actimicrobium antarcticum]|uniref:Uncharacterized protein n=1 Tax=Actimicrobium antarcticum TaxID=1051899 RepID=A0ABP7TNM3_9BURK